MPVALIIGAGAKVGQASAETFAAAGYKVAVASRTQRLDSTKFPFFKFDAAEPDQVSILFEKVHKKVGIPDVVIYNAYASAPANGSVSFDFATAEEFHKRMNVNATTPTIVAHEATKGFLKLESEGKLGPGGATYLFTGNALNEKTAPGFFSLGVGKTASAYVIEHLALHGYNDNPFSYYFIDEREPNGTPMYHGVNGDAHADVFLQLAQDPKQRPWQYTFSKKEGYAVFSKDWA
ncbi:putative NAD P-binding protein [Rosellinia necatrix]|uniref:Putative NAD P-binding protein n=1 Tax=Rosellinia necatrix TaxID=77044 RepID=A0A1S7UL94_ROSNE|nr:putative NAD P-binding protein [Rosellinia necatrix]